MRKAIPCLLAMVIALGFPLTVSVPSSYSARHAPSAQEYPGEAEYPQVIITDTIDASGNGTSVAQVSFKNTDTYAQTFDTWWWAASASQQSNIQAWDAQGPISVQTETIGSKLYIYILFRHSLPPGETYTYWLSTDIQGLAWWNGSAWVRSFCLCAGIPVDEYVVKLTLPSDTTVVSASPQPLTQGPGYVEWVFYNLSSWQCAYTSASYRSTCPAGNIPIVLIHGWHGPDEVENSQFRYMKSWLEADGCDVYYATGISANLTLQQNAPILRENIDYVKAQTGAKRVIIIGHSRGGLNARAYTESSLYEYDVDKVIMLGTPNAGATLWYTDLYLDSKLWAQLTALYPPGDILSTFELQPAYMQEVFNRAYRNDRNIPYYLIGGDANDIPVIKDPPNDFLAAVASVHSATGSHNVRMRTHDAHGWDWPTQHGYSSYLLPRATYDACIRPALAGTEPSEQCFVTSSPSVTLAEVGEHMVHTPYQTSVIAAAQTLTHSVPITATGNSQFHLVWDHGDLDLALLDPVGTTIDPALAETSPNVDFVAFEPDTIINYNTYAISDTIAGTWTLTVTANYTEPMDVAFTTFATLEPALDLHVSTDKTLYHLNEEMVVTAALTYGSMGLTGASVEAVVGRPDVVSETLTLYDDGAHQDNLPDDGTYANAYGNTDIGGPYTFFITAEGALDSVPYARANEVTVQVSPETADLTGGYSDYPQDADDNGRCEYLVTGVEVDVASAGDFLVSGILLGVGDEEIASAVHPVSLPSGIQTVPLRFDGDLIYLSGLDGPYTLTQVFLMDSTGLPIKLDEAYDAWTTTPYDHTKFGLNDEGAYVPLVMKSY